MKKITLFAFIGSNNLGDEAIFYSIISTLIKNGYFINVLSFNPKKTNSVIYKFPKSQFRIFNAKNPFHNIKAIRDCDLFLCGGGGIIQDGTSIYNLPRYLSIIILANFLNKKIMLYGVGAGPIYSSVSKLIVGKILCLVDLITVRDKKSKELLINCGVKGDIIKITADPAISLKKSFINGGTYYKSKYKKKKIIICLRHWFDINRLVPVNIAKKLHIQSKGDKIKQANFVKEFSNFLNYCQNNLEFQLIFLPFWKERDNKIHKEVIDNLIDSKGVIMINRGMHPIEATRYISKADILIGMRLHSIILAVANRIPFIGLTYSQKVNNFLDLVLPKNLLHNFSLEVENISSRDLINSLNFLIKSNYFQSRKFNKKLKNLLAKEKSNFKLMEKLLNE